MSTLSTLNDHLFKALDRLSDEKLTGEELDAEIKKSDAISKVAKNIIDNSSLLLKAAEFVGNTGQGVVDLPMIDKK